MAELLVIQRQSINRTMFAGDVVCVMPDNWKWGAAERGPKAHNFWTVIEVPGVPVTEFDVLLQPLTVNGQQLFFRKVHLNLLQLSNKVTVEQLFSACVEKSVLPLLN